MSRIGSTQGFTIVEMMVTVTLVAIVAGIAVPNFAQFIRNSQLQAKAEELKSFLLLARNEAISNRAQVRLVFNANTPWEIQRPGKSNEVVHTLEFNPAQANLVAMNANDATISELLYRPSGIVSAAARLTVCNENTAETGYLITIASNGSIRLHPKGKEEDNITALADCD
jgi:prepilin-type N-terminal cleavage/methylation domain-containing protein